MKIKVCGITSILQLQELQEIGIDYAGLIFYAQSPRYILNKLKSRDLELANLSIPKVGVFVNASEEDIMTQIELYGLNLVQLHGDETPAFCNHISNHVQVIKAFRLTRKNEQNIDWMIRPYEEACDYYLFDTKSENGYGGSGEKFNWEVLDGNKINKPFFLSGGIAPGDIQLIKSVQHPFLFGVDLNSGFETEPGIKNMEMIRAFKKELSVKEQNIPDELQH